MRGSPYEETVNQIFLSTLHSEEIEGDNEEDCESFQIGMKKLLNELKYSQIETLKQKSIQTGLTENEKRLLLSLLTAKQKLTPQGRLNNQNPLFKETNMNIRVGQGYDVHQLVEGRDLILGGVNIPFEKGLLGHSDADVLLHAITDALLGAAGFGAISAVIFLIPQPNSKMLTAVCCCARLIKACRSWVGRWLMSIRP